MSVEREREEWTEEDERHPDGEPGPMPVQEEGLAVGLEALGGGQRDVSPEIAEELQLMEETEEAEELHGPEEDAVEPLE